MANNLLDTIRQNRGQLVGQQAGITDETQRVQSLLRARKGKQLGPSDAAISNVAEQTVADQTQGQLDQLGQQIGVQQQQSDIEQARQAQQDRIQRQEIEQARKFDTVENRMRTQQLLNELSRDRATLDMEKDKTRLEQAAFLLSMQDKQYVDSLQDIGRRKRLDSDINFREEMQSLAFGDNLDLLRSKLGKQDIMQINDREFKKMMSDLSIDDAIQIAGIESAYRERAGASELRSMTTDYKTKSQQAAMETQAQGLQDVVKAGTGAIGAYADSKKREE